MLPHRKWKVLYHQLLRLKAQRSSFFHTRIFHVVMMDRSFFSCWGFTLLLWAISSIFSPVFSGLQHIAKEKNDTHGLEAGDGNEASPSLSRCVKTVDTEHPALHSRGDVVIGGIFPLHYTASVSQQKYIDNPELFSCTGWDLFTFELFHNMSCALLVITLLKFLQLWPQGLPLDDDHGVCGEGNQR